MWREAKADEQEHEAPEVGRVCDGMVESPQSAVCNSVALLLIFQLCLALLAPAELAL